MMSKYYMYAIREVVSRKLVIDNYDNQIIWYREKLGAKRDLKMYPKGTHEIVEFELQEVL